MFEIEYKGGNTVTVATKKATLVVDPKQSVVGLKDAMIKEAIELSTERDLALNSADARLCIEGPGEYEVADFSIRGTAAFRHIDTPADDKVGTIYRIEIDDIRIALLGNIAATLEEEQLEILGVVDILILPVGGGGYTLDATSAAGLVRRIDPKVVIPVHYADPAIQYPVPQDEVKLFTDELGAPVESMTKYKVKSASNVPPVLTVIELSRT